MAKKHIIKNAYDAYWFIYYHPKFMLRERTEVDPTEADKMEAQGYLITRDPLVKVPPGEESQWQGDSTLHTRDGVLYAGGKCYREWRHLYRHAIDENLSIHYTKTNKPGGHARIDDDKTKNKYVECWLEFGQVYYGYKYSGGKKPQAQWDTETMKQSSHDYRLDTGGTTFDEGLINLAKNIRKHYGDYTRENDSGTCGKPCGDCISIGSTWRKKRKKAKKKLDV